MAQFDLMSWVVSALAAAGWLVLAAAWLWQNRRQRRLEQRLGELEQQLNAVNGASVGMGQRLLKLQRRVRKSPSATAASAASAEPAAGGQAAALLQRDFSGARRPSAEQRLMTLVRGNRSA